MGWGRNCLGLAAIAAAALAAGVPAVAEPVGRADALTQTVPVLMQRNSVPGAVVAVLEDGAPPFVQAFGVRDTATGEPMSTDLSMRIGSISKSFTTTAVLQLVDRGRVGLDDPVGRYVSGVPNGDTITLRELAGMRSGLWDYSERTNQILPDEPDRQWTPEELLAIGYSRSPLFPPNAEFDYSNTNTALLGVVVEKVSGQSLASFITDNIVRPLNLTRTVVPFGAEFPSPHSHGYTRAPDGRILDATDWNASWGFGAGNMISTLDDLVVWVRALAAGALVSPAAQREREKFLLAPSEGDGSLYGLGVEYQNGWIGHNGNIAGFQSYAYFLPAENKTLVMLVNSNVEVLGVWNMFTEIADIVSPAHPWPGPPKGP